MRVGRSGVPSGQSIGNRIAGCEPRRVFESSRVAGVEKRKKISKFTLISSPRHRLPCVKRGEDCPGEEKRRWNKATFSGSPSPLSGWALPGATQRYTPSNLALTPGGLGGLRKRGQGRGDGRGEEPVTRCNTLQPHAALFALRWPTRGLRRAQSGRGLGGLRALGRQFGWLCGDFCQTNTSMIPSRPTTTLIIPFTVKNARPTLERSSGLTSVCSTTSRMPAQRAPMK
jgi:hypothetical protein